MSTLLHRTLILALAVLAALAAPGAQARSSGGHGGGHWGAGHGHGGWGHHGGSHVHWGIGVGIGFGGYWPYAYPAYGYYPYGWGPAYGYVEQPLVVDNPVPAAPAPTFAAKNGQSAAQLEADRRQCDREAMGYPAAMADATVFHRVVLVCMENRGYTIH